MVSFSRQKSRRTTTEHKIRFIFPNYYTTSTFSPKERKSKKLGLARTFVYVVNETLYLPSWGFFFFLFLGGQPQLNREFRKEGELASICLMCKSVHMMVPRPSMR